MIYDDKPVVLSKHSVERAKQRYKYLWLTSKKDGESLEDWLLFMARKAHMSTDTDHRARKLGPLGLRFGFKEKKDCHLVTTVINSWK